jgi:hypothetical protein
LNNILLSPTYFQPNTVSAKFCPIVTMINQISSPSRSILLLFLLLGIALPNIWAQTIIPAGFGAMSATQPSRETALKLEMLT